jgi:hypothetical protein
MLNPGVDAWRSATFTLSKREEGTTMDPMTELNCTRCLELVLESVPGTALQLAALIYAKEVDNVAYFALASKYLAAGSMSAYMSWDWDIDKRNRGPQPYFHGYIPKESLERRGIIGSFLFICSVCCLIVRSLACVCFAQEGLVCIAIVLACEMLIYLFVKASVGDSIYWIPNDGVIGFVVAFLTRFVAKVQVDWTFFVQTRHPNEVGGVGFCWSVVSTVVIGVISITVVGEIQGPFENGTIKNIMIGG